MSDNLTAAFQKLADEWKWDPSMPSRGLGDTIAKITHATGIAQAVHAVARVVGKDCGCNKRQELLNRMVPYARAQVLLGIMSPGQWISTERLARDAALFARALPRQFDAVIGVARSGLIPAAIVATEHHVPLYSVGMSAAHPPSPIVDCGHGWRLETTGRKTKPSRVLIVDDTAQYAISARALPTYVRTQWPGVQVSYGVIYSSTSALRHIDYAAYRYDGGHWLEWNFFLSGHVAKIATDMDGILCDDCPPGDDDDGPRYANWLAHVKPKYLPTAMEVPLIVTARLKKYRQQTEEWLTRHGVRFKRLEMGPWSTIKERTFEGIVQFKTDIYNSSQQTILVESDPLQAKAIRKRTRKQVLCPDAGGMV